MIKPKLLLSSLNILLVSSWFNDNSNRVPRKPLRARAGHKRITGIGEYFRTKISKSKYISTTTTTQQDLLRNEHIETMDKNENKFDVIIIGAGVAGLGAAKSLSNANERVLVLEAKDYIGGRVCTKSIGDEGVIKCDIGATWIEDGMMKNNPIMQLVEEHGIKYLEKDDQDTDGIGYDETTKKQFDYELLDKYIQQFLDGLDDIKEKIEDEKKMSSLSVKEATNYFYRQEELLSDENIQKRIAYYAIEGRYIGMEYGVESHKSSLEYFEEDETEGYYTERKCIFPDGYKQIVDVLANDLTIYLSTPVKHIKYDSSGENDNSSGNVIVTTNDNQVYQAKKVIITVSIGVLKSNIIQFEPSLPQKKQEALQRLDMGISDKIILVFEEQFWDKNRIEFVASNSTQSINYYDFTYAYDQTPTLIGWYTGGSPMHHMTDEELVALSMEQLSLVFNGNVPPKPIAYYITRWKEDPYTQGSYTSIPPGASFDDINIVAETVNDQVFFAGEGTNDIYYGYTHGALLSGLRVAKEINDDAVLSIDKK